MFRKLIKQGNGAYTITLPKSWIEKNKLQEKNELFLIENEGELIIKSNNETNENIKTVELNLDLYTKENYRSIIGSLYRFGYDEIRIKYKDSKIIPILEKSINSLFGLELFFEKENFCIIKSIYGNEKTNIKMHIQRMIYTIQMMQQIIKDDLEKGEFDSKSEIYELRNNILKQRDLILRIIKKQKLIDDKNFPFYTIALTLWSIARNYYHMYNNIEIKDREFIELFQKTNYYFNNSFGKLSVDEKKLLENHKEYNNLFKLLTKELTKSKILSFSLNVVIETQLGQSSLYILSLEKD